jgi:hypothetical protein
VTEYFDEDDAREAVRMAEEALDFVRGRIVLE